MEERPRRTRTRKEREPTAGTAATRVKDRLPEGDHFAGLKRLGHYEVSEKIGQGGMAVVFKGVQPSLNRSVAIKVLPPQFATTPDLLGRFEREASIVASLNHSNIVQVIDRGREGDLLYIVMEYVEGEGLDKAIHAGPLSVHQIVEYAAQICDGLDYAHSAGVIHRDLKPSNILIDRRTGRVKIADFGIAQFDTTSSGVLATLTYDHSAIGTMNYMSPEQRQDAHRVTHLTDIFAFGVVLYEMITGKLPIGHFKLPTLIRPDIPLGLDTIVTKCLAESPADRYPSAAAIREELIRLTGRHPNAPKSSFSMLGRLNKRQRWYALAGATAGVLLVVTALGAGLMRSCRAPAAPPAVPGAHPTAAKPTRPPAAVPPAPPTGDSPEMVEAKVEGNFARAQGLIRQGEFARATKALQELLDQHGSHPLAPEFQYLLATTLYDMKEKEKCKLVYERLIRTWPESARYPEAVLGKCRAEWETAPVVGHLFGADEWNAGLQERLADELQDLLKKQPHGKHVAPTLQLLAAVAEPPAWANTRLAADALARLSAERPAEGADALYRAAELYEKTPAQAPLAATTYARFATEFPDDKRTPKAKERAAKLKPAAAPGQTGT